MDAILDQLQTALADRYRFEDEIGRGGMAFVYRAEDLKHHRTVAIKVLRPELSTELGSERFLREIGIAARITHPHILTLHDSGEADGLLYYVMPYVEGESLRDRLRRERQLPIEETMRIVREIAEALYHAQTHGIVHRDIKPENILFSGGHALVADFGIARAVDAAGSERLTSTGLAVGTPAYMAPEQATGDGLIDARADIYSLGCIAYEMLAGTPPFSGPSAQAVMARHAVDAMPPLRSVRGTVTEAVEAVIEKALAKVPADRFQTPVEFAAALERAQATGEAPVRPGAYAKRRRRSVTGARTAAVAALLVIAAIAVVALRDLRLTALPRLASVAVLPFDNIAGNTDDEPFVAAMRAALAGALGQVGSLRVVWETTDSYRGTNKPAVEVAHELGVDGFVTGAVVRSGDSVQLQVRLTKARPSEQLLWSSGYERTLRDVLTMQGEVARAIAGVVRMRLTGDQERRLSRERPLDPEMYEAYVRGIFHVDKGTPAERRRGVAYLEQAVQLDPGSALAYAGLAYGYVSMGHEPESPPDAWQRARAAAERALALDPTLADAYAVLAAVKTYHEYDWAGAEAAFRRANELNPNLAMNRYHYAWYLALFGRLNEAIAEHKRAQELDPLRPVHTLWLGMLYVDAGRHDDAIAEVRKVLDRNPNHPAASYVMGVVHLDRGNFPEAIAWHERAAEANPHWLGSLGIAYAHAGRHDDARRVLASIEAQELTPYGALVRAQIHAALGELDEAFRWLDYRPAHGWLPWIRVWGGMDRLRQDPRYFAFARRLNLPP